MDLHQARTHFASLERYCYHVAGVVGLLAAGIFGYSNPQTLNYAETLGTAFQLTNIIRDVGEDARKNRIYLPQDELGRFGVPVADILGGRQTEGFSRRLPSKSRKSDHHRALRLLPREDRKPQRPGLVMAAIYRTLLEEIRRDGSQVLAQRVALTPIRKLWIAWRTWVAA